MTRLRAKYGPNYNGPGEYTRPTRRQLLATYNYASADEQRRLATDPEYRRIFGGAGSNKRKDMHIMGGTSASVKRGEVVKGTGVPKGD
jgi:hypothetical protein